MTALVMKLCPPLALQMLARATKSIGYVNLIEYLPGVGLMHTPHLYAFLQSSEVEAIVRQVFAVELQESNRRRYIDGIYEEFHILFASYMNWPDRRVVAASRPLFNALILGCEQALSLAIEDNILAAHEAKSVLRHQILLSEVSTIQRNLELLAKQHKLNIHEIIEFEKKYRAQVANRHRHIIPPDFDHVKRLPINDLYVDPDFILISKKPGDEPKKITIEDFCRGIFRTVLLGDPGGGKSTFTFKLAYTLATRNSGRIAGKHQITPIHVTLREYGAAKKEMSCSILQFITTTAESEYQLTNLPADVFEYLLLNGRILVIFDGLDELLDTSYRLKISADIESFCSLYPAVPVLVTSRKVGYEQAPLAPDQFQVFHLAPFDSGKVKEYVEKWFAIDASLTETQQRQKVTSFMNVR